MRAGMPVLQSTSNFTSSKKFSSREPFALISKDWGVNNSAAMGMRISFRVGGPILAGALVLFSFAAALNAADKPDAAEATPPKVPAETPTEAQQALRAFL